MCLHLNYRQRRGFQKFSTVETGNWTSSSKTSSGRASPAFPNGPQPAMEGGRSPTQGMGVRPVDLKRYSYADVTGARSRGTGRHEGGVLSPSGLSQRHDGGSHNSHERLLLRGSVHALCSMAYLCNVPVRKKALKALTWGVRMGEVVPTGHEGRVLNAVRLSILRHGGRVR